MVRSCLFVLLFAFAVPLAAVQVSTLYDAAVPVADRSDASRSAAIRAALAAVLVKLTGDVQAPKQPGAAELLRNAGTYVRQYGYASLPAPPAPDGSPQPAVLGLSVRFDPDLLNQAVRGAGLYLWGRERPATLVWLAVADSADAAVVGSEDPMGYADALTRRAEARGLPMVLPLLDLDEAAVVTPQLVGAGYGDEIAAASARYRTETVLVGSVKPTESGYAGTWTLALGDTTSTWTTHGDTAAAAIEAGVDNLADALALRYARAPASGPEQEFELAVLGVDSVDGYARVSRYLSSLDAVSRVRLRRVEPGRLLFQVVARGGAEAVAQIAPLGSTLAPAPEQPGAYRLLP